MTEVNSSSSNESQDLPVEARVKLRRVLLDEFAEYPTDDQLWQTAYEWVRAEGDHPGQTSIAADVPADELITMADTVRKTPQAERYNLMAQRASNGKYWFDVIEGFSSDQVRRVQADMVKSWVADQDSSLNFYNALDIGTGVGKSLAILEGCADNVVGLDQNPTLLSIAKERAGADTSLVQGSADKLPFEDSGFDLISSQGLRAALDKSSAKNFLRELARVMTPDGIYIEGHYYSPYDDHPHPELARFTETSKAMLSDMIGDSVSGALDRTDSLSGEEEHTFLAGVGLREHHHAVLDEDGVSHTLITVITKED
ncbi:MAG TPA: class I SAM-dependent methyltransferase [Candidatus Saccharimonadales bacterium]|nr:class I SAM-dependent methyltransferase [Candidatus Saccharimonadales bacterium]